MKVAARAATLVWALAAQSAGCWAALLAFHLVAQSVDETAEYLAQNWAVRSG
jgi:hypothetical protein